MSAAGPGRVTTWLVPMASAFVILGVAIAFFLNPVWVGFEQDRAGVGPLTGECPVTYHASTNTILHDLLFGGDLAGAIGAPAGSSTCQTFALALTDGERSHMRDVRGVFQGFGLLVLASLATLAFAWRRARERDSRSAWWRAVRRGAGGLTVVIAILGAISLVAFDAAFEVFHRLFFAPGSYDFDPATSRLVQLFPDQFWSETTIALGVVAIVLALATAWYAGRRAATDRSSAATATTLPVREAAG